MIHLPDLNLSAVLPIILVAIGSMAILMGEVLLSRADTVFGRKVTEPFIGTVLAVTAIIFFALALWFSAFSFAGGGVQVFNPDNPMYQLDPFSSLIIAVVALSALLSCALSIAYLSELRINHGEYYALILLSASGMMLMVAAVDLIAVFLGLELMSIPIYVLAGFDRRKLRSNESALKYFLIGSFASAILLYGHTVQERHPVEQNRTRKGSNQEIFDRCLSRARADEHSHLRARRIRPAQIAQQ